MATASFSQDLQDKLQKAVQDVVFLRPRNPLELIGHVLRLGQEDQGSTSTSADQYAQQHQLQAKLEEALQSAGTPEQVTVEAVANVLLATGDTGRSDAGNGRVICFSDIHGNLEQLRQLWERLGQRLGTAERDTTTIVFLGDFCDRGPDSKGVIDWLLKLRRTHRAPVHCIMGNHDFGMAAFLGCLPISGPPPFDLETTKNPAFKAYDEKRDQLSYWPHSVPGGMHYIGRRWAQGAVYTARPTFESYGVTMPEKYGAKKSGKDPAQLPPELRSDFIARVPPEHKAFLASLAWVAEVAVDWGEHKKLICAHAGLNNDAPLETQLEAMRARALHDRCLYAATDKERERLVFATERKDVWPMHPELKDKKDTLLVSGHHGVSFAEGDRIILDRAGGMPEAMCPTAPEHFAPASDKLQVRHPMEAIVLPERTVVGHDGSERTLTSMAGRIGIKVDEDKEKAAKKEREKAAAA